jgi:hypothetical protein
LVPVNFDLPLCDKSRVEEVLPLVALINARAFHPSEFLKSGLPADLPQKIAIVTNTTDGGR